MLKLDSALCSQMSFSGLPIAQLHKFKVVYFCMKLWMWRKTHSRQWWNILTRFFILLETLVRFRMKVLKSSFWIFPIWMNWGGNETCMMNIKLLWMQHCIRRWRRQNSAISKSKLDVAAELKDIEVHFQDNDSKGLYELEFEYRWEETFEGKDGNPKNQQVWKQKILSTEIKCQQNASGQGFKTGILGNFLRSNIKDGAPGSKEHHVYVYGLSWYWACTMVKIWVQWWRDMFSLLKMIFWTKFGQLLPLPLSVSPLSLLDKIYLKKYAKVKPLSSWSL